MKKSHSRLDALATNKRDWMEVFLGTSKKTVISVFSEHKNLKLHKTKTVGGKTQKGFRNLNPPN